jgi:hypothetical protein
VSKKQHNLMAMVAHDPAAAKRLGIKQSVGKEFVQADRGKNFKEGGMAESKKMVGKEVAFMKKKGAPKSMIKHEESEMAGMKKGGVAKYAKGGSIKEARMEPAKMEKGGDLKKGNKKFGEHAIQQKGHTRGKNMGDSGKTVGIQSGARGMRKGGMCK